MFSSRRYSDWSDETNMDEQDREEELIDEYEKDAGLGDNDDEDLPEGWFCL